VSYERHACGERGQEGGDHLGRQPVRPIHRDQVGKPRSAVGGKLGAGQLGDTLDASAAKAT
jgi:hypothetical protein